MLIKKRKDCVELEKILTAGSDWAVNRQMKSSIDECKMVCPGRHSPSFHMKWWALSLALPLWNKPLGLQ